MKVQFSDLEKLSKEVNDLHCYAIIQPDHFMSRGFPELASTVFLSKNKSVPYGIDFKTFSTRDRLRYDPFCDEFGPMNFLSIVRFVEILDEEIRNSNLPLREIVYDAGDCPREFTNAAFLLGAYMIIKLDKDADSVWKCFDSKIDPAAFEEYRDATFTKPTFRLSLLDCWKGLQQGKQKGWIGLPNDDRPSLWGQIDADMYQKYDRFSQHGDLHIIVPGKFIAFKGPTTTTTPDAAAEPCNLKPTSTDAQPQRPQPQRRGLAAPTATTDPSNPTGNGSNDARPRRMEHHFTPGHYADIFRRLGVSTVIRLNEPCYPRDAFTAHGFDHIDIPFADCVAPPTPVVQAFFRTTDAAAGAVAVHCRAGLGRTGTLLALSLIRSHGFSARGAIGWLRIMRPGSVIGEQQDFLCAVESAAVGSLISRRPPAAASLPNAPASSPPATPPLHATPSAAVGACQTPGPPAVHTPAAGQAPPGPGASHAAAIRVVYPSPTIKPGVTDSAAAAGAAAPTTAGPRRCISPLPRPSLADSAQHPRDSDPPVQCQRLRVCQLDPQCQPEC